MAFWYNAGDIPSANVIAAYDPVGSVSLAESYTNIANPGTYNAAPGTAPAWSNTNGWQFTAASSQYLDTGIQPTGNYTVIIQISGATVPITMPFGCRVGPNNKEYYFYFSATLGLLWESGSGGNLFSRVVPAGNPTAAVIGLAGQDGYWDGRWWKDGAAASFSVPQSIYIGAFNNNGTASNFFTGYVLKMAIYDTVLTQAQVLAVSHAMDYTVSTARPAGLNNRSVHEFADAVIPTATKSFVCYLGSNATEWAMELDKATNTWSMSYAIGDGRLTSGAVDSHNYPTWAMDSSGYIHVLYGCHNSPLYYRKSTNPNDISSWGDESLVGLDATYPRILIDSNDYIHIFYRTSNHRYAGYRKSTNGGTTWSTVVNLIDAVDNNSWTYVCDARLGSDDSIHLVWTWRLSQGVDSPSEFWNVMYMCSRDGGATWEKSDGTDYTLPVVDATAEKVMSGQYVFAHSCPPGADNNARVVYVKSDPDVYFTKCHVHYCYLSGGAWQDVTLPGQDYQQGANMVIDGADYYIFDSQLVDGVYEIVQFLSRNSGGTWTTTQLTSGSTVDNTYVVVTRKADQGIEIAWGQGTEVKHMDITAPGYHPGTRRGNVRGRGVRRAGFRR